MQSELYDTIMLLLSTPLHQRAASRVQHPNHVAANSLSTQVARKCSTLSGFVQRSRLEREVGRDLHSIMINQSINHDTIIMLLLLLLSTPLHQRAASRVQHPKSCGSQQSLPPGGKERLHFVGIRPEVQARKGGW